MLVLRHPDTAAGLLSLGARPEAAVCLDCATHLHRRARARQNPPAAARRPHAAAERLRGAVTHAGLHRKPVISPVLRWISRQAPF